MGWVLSISKDPVLAYTRAGILREAGHTVTNVSEAVEASTIISNSDIDLVMICQSFPADEMRRLVQWMRREHPRTPILTFSRTDGLSFLDGTNAMPTMADPSELV